MNKNIVSIILLFIIISIGIKIISLINGLNNEIQNIKTEHHVIIQYQYKEPIKDTIYIIKNKPNDWK